MNFRAMVFLLFPLHAIQNLLVDELIELVPLSIFKKFFALKENTASIAASTCIGKFIFHSTDR